MKRVKSIDYFRDLGGYATDDGRIVKKGILFRTSEGSKVSPKDIDIILNDYNIKYCFDLRTDDEVKLKPDGLTDKLEYYHLPLLKNEQNPAVTKETRLDILKANMEKEGAMKRHLSDLYRLIVSEEQSINGLKKIFEVLLNNDELKGAMYHCTQGKDRTGMVSALILLALGVKKEAVIEDYLKFNRYNRFKRFWIFMGMTTVFFSIPMARNLDIALKTNRLFINSAFDEMEKLCGSISNYLRDKLGLDDNKINKLKTLYTVGA